MASAMLTDGAPGGAGEAERAPRVGAVPAGTRGAMPGGMADAWPERRGDGRADADWEELDGGPARRGRLVVSRGASRLVLSCDPAQQVLVRARFDGLRPDVRVSEGVVRVRSRFAPLSWIRELLHGRNEASELVLRGDLPWDLRLDGGLNRLDADLSRGEISSLRVDGGVSSARIVLPVPRGTVKLRFDGGVNHVELVRPAGVPVRARVDGGLSSLELDGDERGAAGARVGISSPGWGESADRYDVRVSGGVCHAVVTSGA